MASLKNEVRSALLASEFDRILGYARDNRRVFGVLISLAYDKQSLATWRAVEAMGMAVGQLAETDPGAARDIIHRLLWSVTEESGSIGWSAPEMLAEIVINGAGRFDDLPPIILSLEEEPPFVPGVLWTVGRLAQAGAPRVPGAAGLVRRSLADDDPQVRGLATWAAGQLRLPGCAEKIASLTADGAVFTLYEDHQLSALQISALAASIYPLLQVNHEAL